MEYAYPVASESFYDGTTDGLYNYSASFNTGRVYRFDRNWSAASATLLFEVGNIRPLGITYDPVNSSLWISTYNGSSLTNYSLTGTQLGSFSTVGSLASLAMDYADNTLWVGTLNGSLYAQYSRLGVQLQQARFGALTGQNVLGAEFDFGLNVGLASTAAPEPSTIVLVGGGLALVGVAAGRRRAARV